MNCIQECPSLNIFAAGACPCMETMREMNEKAYIAGNSGKIKTGPKSVGSTRRTLTRKSDQADRG